MLAQTLRAPTTPRSSGQSRLTLPARRGPRHTTAVTQRWIAIVLILVALGVVFVLATGMRPAYDAYGWLVWGRQAAHLHLDTNAAPSWKPLTFLYTFPYALIFGRAALWLWMVTAVTAGFAAAVFGALVAYRLTERPPGGSRLPALTAGALGGAGVLGIEGYWHFMLIATADPMMVALCLGAIYAALDSRPRVAWLLIVLLCLGRPEALGVVLAYAVWGAWRVPSLRPALAAGLVAIPVLWFGVPALTSHSWLIAGDVLSDSTLPLRGDKVTAVLRGFVSLYELPMQIAVIVALVLGVITRKRSWLLITAAAASWLAVDIALAVHGWGITPRYMFEPAAAAVVLAAGAAGTSLATRPRRLVALRWAAAGLVASLVVTLAPQARIRARLAHNGIVLGQRWSRQIHRLHELIAREGGPKRILACGQAVTTVPYQSILAWELDENVVDVGWVPETWQAVARHMGLAIVLFRPVGVGWQVSVHGSLLVPSSARCGRLAAATPTD